MSCCYIWEASVCRVFGSKAHFEWMLRFHRVLRVDLRRVVKVTFSHFSTLRVFRRTVGYSALVLIVIALESCDCICTDSRVERYLRGEQACQVDLR